MIISFNTGKIETKGGGNLQQKKVTVTENGLDVIVPDAGYDGFSTVYIKTDVGDGGSSYKDFTVIGYDDETSIMLNNKIDDDIAYSKSLYDAWNPENTSAKGLYKNNTKLVYAPSIDISNVNDLSNLFNGCTNLTYVPKYTLPNIKTCMCAFSGCEELQSIDITDWKLGGSSQSDIAELFNGCSKLTEIKGIEDFDVSNINALTYVFNRCDSLTRLDLSKWKPTGLFTIAVFASGCNNLTYLDISGFDLSNLTNHNSPFPTNNNFTDLKYGYNLKMSVTSFQYCKGLNVNSLLSILNGLYDFTGNGETPTSTQGKLTLGSTNLAKLTDEQKAIATGKGWVLN